jgi:hypothetical protein
MNKTPNDQNSFPLINYWQEYKKLGGKHNKKKFFANVDIFLDICLPSYAYGEGDLTREEAFTKWENYVGDPDEARIYFTAIDNITALS